MSIPSPFDRNKYVMIKRQIEILSSREGLELMPSESLSDVLITLRHYREWFEQQKNFHIVNKLIWFTDVNDTIDVLISVIHFIEKIIKRKKKNGKLYVKLKNKSMSFSVLIDDIIERHERLMIDYNIDNMNQDVIRDMRDLFLRSINHLANIRVFLNYVSDIMAQLNNKNNRIIDVSMEAVFELYDAVREKYKLLFSLAKRMYELQFHFSISSDLKYGTCVLCHDNINHLCELCNNKIGRHTEILKLFLCGRQMYKKEIQDKEISLQNNVNTILPVIEKVNTRNDYVRKTAIKESLKVVVAERIESKKILVAELNERIVRKTKNIDILEQSLNPHEQLVMDYTADQLLLLESITENKMKRSSWRIQKIEDFLFVFPFKLTSAHSILIRNHDVPFHLLDEDMEIASLSYDHIARIVCLISSTLELPLPVELIYLEFHSHFVFNHGKYHLVTEKKTSINFQLATNYLEQDIDFLAQSMGIRFEETYLEKTERILLKLVNITLFIKKKKYSPTLNSHQLFILSSGTIETSPETETEIAEFVMLDDD